MEFFSTNKESFTHSTIDHYSNNFELCTTIGCTFATGVALAAVHIRLDRTMLTGLDIGHVTPDFEYLDSKLMAGNSWIPEEGHLPKITADIGSTNSDAMDPN
jgi:hypothetical protein